MADTVGGNWTFLSNHTHVLVCLATDDAVTLRDVATRVGLTERGVQRIVAELELAGVLQRHREGRRNVYRIDTATPLRHPLEAHCRIGDLLQLVVGEPGDSSTGATVRAAPSTGTAAVAQRGTAAGDSIIALPARRRSTGPASSTR